MGEVNLVNVPAVPAGWRQFPDTRTYGIQDEKATNMQVFQT